jgi:hypothetical protein
LADVLVVDAGLHAVANEKSSAEATRRERSPARPPSRSFPLVRLNNIV